MNFSLRAVQRLSALSIGATICADGEARDRPLTAGAAELGDLPMRIFGMEALAFAFMVSFVAGHQDISSAVIGRSRQIRPRSSIGDPFPANFVLPWRRAADSMPKMRIGKVAYGRDCTSCAAHQSRQHVSDHLDPWSSGEC